MSHFRKLDGLCLLGKKGKLNCLKEIYCNSVIPFSNFSKCSPMSLFPFILLCCVASRMLSDQSTSIFKLWKQLVPFLFHLCLTFLLANQL